MSTTTQTQQQGMAQPPTNFEVELPGGGKLHLQTIDEVELFETSRDNYLQDFRITGQSDKLAIGGLITQHLEVFRAQQRLNGMEPEIDAQGLPTGRYKSSPIKAQERTAALNVVLKVSQEIREMEKALGIDKKTRDQGGQYDVKSYVDGLKLMARTYGAHISKRYKAYDALIMEARVKLRMLINLDPEDLAHENLTPETFCDWMRNELGKLEEVDKEFANEKGKVFVGRAR